MSKSMVAAQRAEDARIAKEKELEQFLAEFPMRLICLMARINTYRGSYSYEPNAKINYDLIVKGDVSAKVLFSFFENADITHVFNLTALDHDHIWQFDMIERVVSAREEEHREEIRQREFKKATLEKAKSLLTQEELRALGL